jgi:pyrimidine operon attenuation protein/uracil phosphoribosyltransferase
VGKNVPTSHRENVAVMLMEEDGLDEVQIVESVVPRNDQEEASR